MPRTKRIQRKVSTLLENAYKVEEDLDKECEADLQNLKLLRASFETKIICMCSELRLSVPRDKLFLTLSEYSNANNSKIHKSTTKRSVARSTKRVKNKRSLSAGEDEGYRTTDSSSGSGVSAATRQSRSALRSASKTRQSRSLSRTNLVKPSANRTNLKTPANRRPPTNVGTITPKVNLGTPQAILRRPRNGEIAVSLQGSPLLTAAYANSESTANVNIPLPDGRLLSLQPSRALRTSQIPDFDDEVRKQLETLRDNLNKVCAKY